MDSTKLIKRLADMKPQSVIFIKKADWYKQCKDTPALLLYKLSRNKTQVFYGRTYGSKPLKNDYVIVRGRE